MYRGLGILEGRKGGVDSPGPFQISSIYQRSDDENGARNENVQLKLGGSCRVGVSAQKHREHVK